MLSQSDVINLSNVFNMVSLTNRVSLTSCHLAAYYIYRDERLNIRRVVGPLLLCTRQRETKMSILEQAESITIMEEELSLFSMYTIVVV
jgi:hypothetical protein